MPESPGRRPVGPGQLADMFGLPCVKKTWSHRLENIEISDSIWFLVLLRSQEIGGTREPCPADHLSVGASPLPCSLPSCTHRLSQCTERKTAMPGGSVIATLSSQVFFQFRHLGFEDT